MKLTMDQVAIVVYDTGFRASAPDAIAIIWAESGGDTAVHSANPDGGTNVGLAQIDQKAHPQWTIGELENAYTNVHAMWNISNGGHDWGPWATWPNPAASHRLAAQASYTKIAAMTASQRAAAMPPQAAAWRAGLGAAAGAIPGMPADLLGGGNPLDWLSNIGGFFSRLAQPATWLRIGEVILGLILIATGANRLAGGAVQRTLGRLAPV